MILTFGKYKGQLISDVPDAYLEWLDEQEWVHGLLRQRLDFELIQRGCKLPNTVKSGDIASITTIYKKLAKQYHPDKGGSTEGMQALNDFYSELKQLFK